MKYKRVDLPFGAKLYYCKNNISKITLVDVAFECGARVETTPGLAHFVEHMFFAGTKKLKKTEVVKKYYDFIDVNAFTTYSNIVFCGRVFTQEFKDYLSTIAMLINESNFTPKAIEEEKKVVIQEILLDADNNIYKSHKFNMANVTLDPVHKVGLTGTKDTVNSITQRDVKNFVKKYFVAENAEVYVCSPLSLNEVKSIVIKNLLNIIPSNKKFEKPANCWPYNVENDKFFKTQTKKIDKCYLFVNFKLDKTDFDHKFKRQFMLVSDMFNDISEGIMKRLRIDKSLVYSSYLTKYFNDKNSFVSFQTECNKENLKEVVITLFDYIADIAENGFTNEQLEKAKRNLKYSIHAKEPSASRDFSRIHEFKYFDKVISRRWLDKITYKTTLEECNKIFKEVFINKNVSLSLYGDFDKDEFLTKKEFEKIVEHNND